MNARPLDQEYFVVGELITTSKKSQNPSNFYPVPRNVPATEIERAIPNPDEQVKLFLSKKEALQFAKSLEKAEFLAIDKSPVIFTVKLKDGVAAAFLTLKLEGGFTLYKQNQANSLSVMAKDLDFISGQVLNQKPVNFKQGKKCLVM